MYTKMVLGKELEDILKKSYDIVKIAKWAENIYITHCRDLSTELDDIVMALSFMEHGPEFEYTEQELRLLAEKLING